MRKLFGRYLLVGACLQAASGSARTAPVVPEGYLPAIPGPFSAPALPQFSGSLLRRWTALRSHALRAVMLFMGVILLLPMETVHSVATIALVPFTVPICYRRLSAVLPESGEGLSYPPAIAPTSSKGSAPLATASGSGVPGASCDQSSPQAKKRTNGRRWCCLLYTSRCV